MKETEGASQRDFSGSVTLHPLLQEQLRRHVGDRPGLPPDWERLIAEVNEAYERADADRMRVRHSMRFVTEKLTERNKDLHSQLIERQRAEAQLEGLLFLLGATLESTADGILAVGGDGKIIRFNQPFVAMWRIPDSILAFWTHQQVMDHMIEQMDAPAQFLARLEEAGQKVDLEIADIVECADGRVFECCSSAQPLGWNGGGRVLSFRDITVRRRTEETLKREQAAQQALIKKLEETHNQLLQSEKMASIGQLAAGVAHEINNPIAFVNSNLGTLRKYLDQLLQVAGAYERAESCMAGDPDRQAELRALKQQLDLDFLRSDVVNLMDESEEGIKRVRQIVNDLKDFSHVDCGEWQPYDLHKGIDSTLNIVRNEIKYKAEVVKEYGDIPPVECLPSQINQVFMNLLVNAGHAIEHKGVITLRTGTEGDQVWVEVSDTGMGIRPENLKRIFDPFFTTKPVGKGTGLGLSVSYGIIDKHHGRITVTSTLGEGTVFRVTLPVRQDTTAAPLVS